MSLNIPESAKIITDRMRSSLKSSVPQCNPFDQADLIYYLISCFGGAVYQNYLKIEDTVNNLFPQTAKGNFLYQWGDIRGVTLKPSTQSSGYFSVNGLDGSIIPAGTLVTNGTDGSASVTYETIDVSVVTIRSLANSSWSYTDPFLYITFDNDHSLATGLTISLSGLVPNSLNISYPCIVIDDKNIQINIGSIPTPTGNPLITVEAAILEVESQEFGANTNLTSGAPLIFSNLIAGVDQTGFVLNSQIAGGADKETDEEYRKRVMFAWQNPGSPFSVPMIIKTALSVPGVTRVFVVSGTGIVKVFFTLDNNKNNIPPSSVVQTVREKLETIKDAGLYPDNRFIVAAPQPVIVDFIITNLIPNNPTIKLAIIDNLQYFLRNVAPVGQPIDESSLYTIIQETIDPNTGIKVKSFILTQPSLGVNLSEGQIGVLGNVQFL